MKRWVSTICSVIGNAMLIGAGMNYESIWAFAVLVISGASFNAAALIIADLNKRSK